MSDFEEGRKLQRLDLQIRTLYYEIILGSGKDNDAQKKRLQSIMNEAYDSYLTIALSYPVSRVEICEISDLYNKVRS